MTLSWLWPTIAPSTQQRRPSSNKRPKWARDIPCQSFKQHARLLTLESAVLINTPFVGPYYTSPTPHLSSSPTSAHSPARRLRPTLSSQHSLLQHHQNYHHGQSHTQNENNNDYHSVPPQISLAVFARFDDSNLSSTFSAPSSSSTNNLWLAVRKIQTSSREQDNLRQTSLTWVHYSEFATFLESCVGTGYQVFEPKKALRRDAGDEAGALDGGSDVDLDVEKVMREWMWWTENISEGREEE